MTVTRVGWTGDPCAAPAAVAPARMERPSSASAQRVRANRRRSVALRLGCCVGCIERGQLLLRRELSALGHDERLHLDLDVLEDLDRDRVAADALDRIRRDL